MAVPTPWSRSRVLLVLVGLISGDEVSQHAQLCKCLQTENAQMNYSWFSQRLSECHFSLMKIMRALPITKSGQLRKYNPSNPLWCRWMNAYQPLKLLRRKINLYIMYRLYLNFCLFWQSAFRIFDIQGRDTVSEVTRTRCKSQAEHAPRLP